MRSEGFPCSSSLNLYIVQRVQCMIRCSLSNDSRAIEGTHENWSFSLFIRMDTAADVAKALDENQLVLLLDISVWSYSEILHYS
ncbi:hypothetical protein QQP08_023344 [Theobroma cacao]|nr:hypothetical protein QQP08_023344 [Theobroma cacao]